MQNAEKKVLDLLADLKNNYGVIGVKSEFEAEGCTFEEAEYLRELTLCFGLEYNLKISGAQAMRDFLDAKKIMPDYIVVPMIESPFSLKKFVETAMYVFENDKKPMLLINIESIQGLNNFNVIMESKYMDYIKGIVFGRSDMCDSIGKNKDYVNSQEILSFIQRIALETKKKSKDFMVGGNITVESEDFLKQIHYLNKFETRKIIFDNNICNRNFRESVQKSLEFEIAWLEFSQQKFNLQNKIMFDRIKAIKSRFQTH